MPVMDRKVFFSGAVCLAAGIMVGYAMAPDAREEPEPPLMARISSEGRAEIRAMKAGLEKILRTDAADIAAEKTRALQAMTQKTPDRKAAEFHMAGMEAKMSSARAKIDGFFLDALEKMPLADRRTYMNVYLKNRESLKRRMLMLPLMAEAALEEEAGEGFRPRDMVVRKVGHPD